MNEENIDSVVFYDGDCGFCNSSIQFILNKRKRRFYFSPLQSEFAEEKLKKFGIKINLDTIYYSKNGKLYERSSAAIQICKGLRGLWPMMLVFYVVPRFIRDAVYNAIARRRHRIRAGYCMIPTPEERKLFIGISD